MNILKRELAPISAEVWEEIDQRAKEVLNTILSARKAVKVLGPKGWDYAVVPEGRLEILEEGSQGQVNTGMYKIKPLVEARVSFELDRWELDNIVRGAKDIELAPLEEAVRDLAVFEEKAIYSGYEKGSIEGLDQCAAHNIDFGNDVKSIMSAMSEARFKLIAAYEKGPYTLVVGKEAYKRLNVIFEGYPLYKIVKSILGGEIILSEAIEGAYLFPYDHENIELTIGQDFSIGYVNHTADKLKLFVTESFTFRVLDNHIIVKFNV